MNIGNAPSSLGRKESLQWERTKDIPANMTARGADHSDRLFQWGPAKYNYLAEKHFGNRGQWFHQREPAHIEAFLAEYFGLNLALLYIVQGENLANGYPYWVFGYAYEKSEQ